ncbi:PREDICTED: uncharacterized protein LOC106806040 [Priapulus caudatus]|uniref:Uncharacterized protein LOC106806040 n=1 Tax=Priapulus caudatus TaxID=37621 RepID=A0ABM1DTU7_PRICU|nr:PREDICTED: uncharacterized protein LOC106806040 [Priapulus caudatus]
MNVFRKFALLVGLLGVVVAAARGASLRHSAVYAYPTDAGSKPFLTPTKEEPDAAAALASARNTLLANASRINALNTPSVQQLLLTNSDGTSDRVRHSSHTDSVLHVGRLRDVGDVEPISAMFQQVVRGSAQLGNRVYRRINSPTVQLAAGKELRSGIYKPLVASRSHEAIIVVSASPDVNLVTVGDARAALAAHARLLLDVFATVRFQQDGRDVDRKLLHPQPPLAARLAGGDSRPPDTETTARPKGGKRKLGDINRYRRTRGRQLSPLRITVGRNRLYNADPSNDAGRGRTPAASAGRRPARKLVGNVGNTLATRARSSIIENTRQQDARPDTDPTGLNAVDSSESAIAAAPVPVPVPALLRVANAARLTDATDSRVPTMTTTTTTNYALLNAKRYAAIKARLSSRPNVMKLVRRRLADSHTLQPDQSSSSSDSRRPAAGRQVQLAGQTTSSAGRRQHEQRAVTRASAGRRQYEQPAVARASAGRRQYDQPAVARASSGRRQYDQPAVARASAGRRQHEQRAVTQASAGRRQHEQPAVARASAGHRQHEQPAVARASAGRRQYEQLAVALASAGRRQHEQPAVARASAGRRQHEQPAVARASIENTRQQDARPDTDPAGLNAVESSESAVVSAITAAPVPVPVLLRVANAARLTDATDSRAPTTTTTTTTTNDALLNAEKYAAIKARLSSRPNAMERVRRRLANSYTLQPDQSSSSSDARRPAVGRQVQLAGQTTSSARRRQHEQRAVTRASAGRRQHEQPAVARASAGRRQYEQPAIARASAGRRQHEQPAVARASAGRRQHEQPAVARASSRGNTNNVLPPLRATLRAGGGRWPKYYRNAVGDNFVVAPASSFWFDVALNIGNELEQGIELALTRLP